MRRSGILLPISSLANGYGIGSLGKEAYDFVDFLYESKTTVWQVLPIGQTSFGDSPYQSVSSFAGNPYFIDLDVLVEEGLLLKKDLPKNKNGFIDYGELYHNRYDILKKSYIKSYNSLKTKINSFKRSEKWLSDYALFMAIKNHYNGMSWLEWPNELLRKRDDLELKKYAKILKQDINFYYYIQYLFYKQWNSLKKYATKKNIKICGDLPIYCALDSADVWANTASFQLDEELNPVSVAGVPPDYFSINGQLWGNPLFDWDNLKKNNFDFWIERINGTAKLFDIVRLDHFIGFANYYSVSSSATTAKDGVWIDGPGAELFHAIKKSVPNLEIIAEDLGVLNDKVINLKDEFNLPGMNVLMFMIDINDDKGPTIKNKNSVIYTGTHDNETTLSWWNNLDSDVKVYIMKFLAVSTDKNIVNKLVEFCFKSESDLVVIPIQDYLNLGSEARINTPGTTGENWKFRLKPRSLNVKLSTYIKKLNTISNR